MKILYHIFHFVTRHENWCFLIFFALLVGVVDSNSLWERHYVWESTAFLKQEIHDYQQRYREDSVRLDDLKNNPRRLEQLARERYYMSRPNEDIFIIQEGDEVPGKLMSENSPTEIVGR